MLKHRLRKVITPIYHSGYLLNHRHFRRLEAICLPIGFPNCANKTLAGILTAHPYVVMSNQLDLLESWWHNLSAYSESLARKMLLSDIHRLDREISLDNAANGENTTKFYSIPNQWQGRSQQIMIIGDHSPATNTKVLMKKAYMGQEAKCMGLNTFLRCAKVPVKFIFSVRNPYDLISANTIHSTWKKEQQEILNIMINRFIVCCERGKTLLDNIPEEQVYIWSLEKHISNPRKTISGLCKFLGVETPRFYLEACAKIFSKKPNKKRRKIDWSEAQKAKVANAINQYDFLCGYNWES